VSRSIYASVAVLAASVLLAACGSSSSSKGSSSATSATTAAATPAASTGATTVKTASNSTVGATILTAPNGLTLYKLSGESAGKFICTSQSCLAVWHPLKATAGTAPSGTSSLGTVMRPDGTEQVTYEGAPLYTFTPDKAPGQTNGQGLKDVGTWTVVKVSGGSAPSQSSAAPASSESSGSGGSGSSSGGGGAYAY